MYGVCSAAKVQSSDSGCSVEAICLVWNVLSEG